MPLPLDYSRPVAPAGVHFARFLALAVSALVALCLFTFVRIEFLNMRAGGVLPRTEPGKWRISINLSERTWREFNAVNKADPSLLTRTLTPVELNTMTSEIDRNRADADLREFVGTFGLVQYLSVPILAFSSVFLFFHMHRKPTKSLALIGTACAVICGFGVFYRGYISSLGW